MRRDASTVLLLVAATLACAPSARPPPAREPPPSPGPPAARVPSPVPPAPWTIAVMSDLHVAVDGSVSPMLRRLVAAVIATRPRLVVVTGDFTDGNPGDLDGRIVRAPQWWRAARQTLEPVHAAGIPVLPVAGNHDSYLAPHRIAYAAAWSDLDRWAAPLEIWGTRQPAGGIALDAAPFSYSVDVDGVHLVLAHIVDARLDRGVARWVAGELALARRARLRLVFGHAPLWSIVGEPRRAFTAELGGLLASGGADLYVAGHEHLVWDDDVPLAGGGSIHQVLVGTASASWRFGPSAEARRRARCVERAARMRCTMPHGGAAFELQRVRDRWLEVAPYSFTLITVDGTALTARAMTLGDRGEVVPFGIDGALDVGPRRPEVAGTR